MTGTLINTGAIIIGGLGGILFGKRLLPRHQETLTMACGVGTLFIGIAMVVEGVVDIAALIMMARSDRLNRQAEKEKKLAEEKQAEAKEEPAALQPEEQPAETAEASEN